MVVLAAVLGVSMARQGQPLYDDPFILYRYAEHVAIGIGWEFNPRGETDNAVTSALVVVLLATGRVLGVGVERGSDLLFFGSMLGAALFTWRFLVGAGLRVAGPIAALLMVSSPVLISFWGMESALVLLFVAAALYCAGSGRSSILVGALLGLLVATRPDMAVVGVSLVAMWFLVGADRRRGFAEWRGLLVGGLVPVGLLLILNLVVTGSAVPSTLAAKMAQMQSGWWPGYIGEGWATIRSLHALDASLAGLWVAALVGAALVGFVSGIRNPQLWRTVATLALASVALVVIYGVLFEVPAYSWYYVIPFYSMLVLASVGVDSALSTLTAREVGRWATIGALGVAVVSVGFVAANRGPLDFRQDYRVVGEWLRDNTAPESTVAALEIGIIGWYSQRDMVDYLGLLDSDANAAIARSDFRWWPHHYQPDYWVTMGPGIDLGMDREYAGSTCLEATFEPVFRTSIHVVLRRIAPIPDPETCQSVAPPAS